MGEWTADYEVRAPSEQALAIDNGTEATERNTSSFGQQLQEQLVVAGADEDLVSSSFTMGTFEETTTIMNATTTTIPTSQSGSGASIPFPIIGGVIGGTTGLLLVALCMCCCRCHGNIQDRPKAQRVTEIPISI